MKNFFRSSIILLSVFIFSSFTPIEEPLKITWETLRDVTFKKKWNAEEAMFVLYPSFGQKITAMKDKEVVLTGYMIPVDIDANMYVLSANPYSSCFFCGGAGPESVVQVKFNKTAKRYNTDDRITVKGILKLNADDINELNYIMEKAEPL